MNQIHSYRKNQEMILKIEDITKEGEGLGKNQGFPFFVKDTVPGDTARVSILKVKKNYGYARLVELITPSPDRVEPPCPVARSCGGCRLQHLAYEKQLEFKQKQVVNCLKRIGGFQDPENCMEPIMGMEDPWHYRNKAQFPVGRDKNGRLVAGFYAGRTHVIIPNTDCLIQAEENRQILETVLAYMDRFQVKPYDEKNHTGLVRHILTRKSRHTGQIMVCLVSNGKLKDYPNMEVLVENLKEIKGMTGILINSNQEKTNRILGTAYETAWGRDYIEDRIGDIRFHIGPLSFYQVNPLQTEKLYAKALEYANLHGGETVWDMYCGIGTISLFLAQKAGKVYGVEIVPGAIEDAKRNARINGMDNTEFYVGKAEEIVPAWYRDTEEKADVVVVDPPRKGCDRILLETILAMSPQRIVYVSCDPATLARDLKILCEKEYVLESWAATDMFPHSTHIEVVSLLQRVSNTRSTGITLDVEMKDYYRIKASDGGESDG